MGPVKTKILINDFSNDMLAMLLCLFLRRRPTLFSAFMYILCFERNNHIRSIYSENWIFRYKNADFYMHFRLTRDTFHKLVGVVQCPEFSKAYQGGGVPLNCEKVLLMTLWLLGKGDSLVSIGDRFDVATSTVHYYVNIMIGRLVELVPKYIQWPNAQEIVTIERQFYEICGYPGVIGAIDGCCVNFKAPLNQQDSYIDKNDKHSIKIQAVSTATRIFTNINVGFPGSVHDSRILHNSQLYRDTGLNLLKYFPSEQYHLLGDKAYPILEWLITPFKDYGNLTRRQKIHNYKHSKTRIRVEHTFGIWKSRWRILRYINVNCPKKAAKIIAACCVLHNFCYQNYDEWNDEISDVLEDGNDNVEALHINNENIGIRKRENIANSFI